MLILPIRAAGTRIQVFTAGGAREEASIRIVRVGGGGGAGGRDWSLKPDRSSTRTRLHLRPPTPASNESPPPLTNAGHMPQSHAQTSRTSCFSSGAHAKCATGEECARPVDTMSPVFSSHTCQWRVTSRASACKAFGARVRSASPSLCSPHSRQPCTCPAASRAAAVT